MVGYFCDGCRRASSEAIADIRGKSFVLSSGAVLRSLLESQCHRGHPFGAWLGDTRNAGATVCPMRLQSGQRVVCRAQAGSAELLSAVRRR